MKLVIIVELVDFKGLDFFDFLLLYLGRYLDRKISLIVIQGLGLRLLV